MRERNTTKLRQVIKDVEDSKIKKYLTIDIQVVKKFLQKLTKIEKLKNMILKMSQRTIAEMKSYKDPPVVVYEVMKATLMVLGDDSNKMGVSCE